MAKEHIWKDFSWPLLRNSVRRDREAKRRRGGGVFSLQFVMEIYFTQTLTRNRKIWLQVTFRTKKKKSPPFVHEKSLWRFTASFRVCNDGSQLPWFIFLPVSERWLVLHRRSNFRFHTHRSFPPDSQTSSLWRTVKHCKIHVKCILV